MRFFNLGLEDEKQENTEQPPVDLEPNTVDKAIKAVDNADSTEPEKVIEIANYKEELAAIRAKRKEEDGDTESDDTTSTNNDGDGDGDAGLDNGASAEDTDANNEDTEQENQEDDNEEEEADDGDSSSESEEEVATEGIKSVYAALESILEMSKFKDLLDRKSSLGGVNQATGFIISNALLKNAERTGYKLVNRVPSMEDFNGYTNSLNSTNELKVAVEGFLEGVWEAIKKFFKGIYDWIMQLLGLRKSSNGSTVSTKEERTKREEAVIKAKEHLEEKLKSIDLARERDLQKAKKVEQDELNESIARHLFASNDTGTFSELDKNCENINTALEACKTLLYTVNQTFTKAILTGTLNGKEVPLQDLCIEQNILGNLKVVNRRDDNNETNYVLLTEELVAGVGIEFVLSDKKVAKQAASPESKLRALKDIGKQTFRVSKNTNTKKLNKIRLPKLEQNEIGHLKNIVASIQVGNKLLTELQNNIKQIAEGTEGIFKNSEPTSWQALRANNNNNAEIIITQLKAQLAVIGTLETTAVKGIVGVDKLVEMFSKNFIRLAAQY